MNVCRFTLDDTGKWDAFVAASRNGTFLMRRPFMDYHGDRYADHSLIVEDGGEIVAVVPGHDAGAGLFGSHLGLSYGGIIVGHAMRCGAFVGLFADCCDYLKSVGFAAWAYKTVPSFYHHYPSEDDRYAMFLAGAEISRCDALAVCEPARRPPMQERRVRGAKKARVAGLVCSEDAEALNEYWRLLAGTLGERHDARPVHSAKEIALLHSRFPSEIRLHLVRDPSGELIAGAVIFDTPRAAHVQYIASSPAGRKAGALDLLFGDLLAGPYADRAYFDFGISNEEGGRVLNAGLVDHKEGFGARIVAHLHYRLDLTRCDPTAIRRAVR